MRNPSSLGALAALASVLACGQPQSHGQPSDLVPHAASTRVALTNGAEYALTPIGLMGGEYLCLDIRNGSQDNGAILQLWECNGSPAQSFKRVGQALQAFGGQCLDVVDGQTHSGAKVHMAACEEGAPGQIWVTRGAQLQLEGTDVCLDVVNGLANQGAGLQVWRCEDKNANQQFRPTALTKGNSRSETDDASVKDTLGRKVVWGDEFEQETLDAAHWAREVDTDDTDHIKGKNKEQQHYTKDQSNSFVKGGKLHIKLVKEATGDKAFSSARVASTGDGWTYGRFETRLKVPCGQGLRALAWLRPSDPAAEPWPTSGELILTEVLGGNPNTLHATVHFGEAAPNNESRGDAYTMSSGDFCKDFHVFAMERTHEDVTWLLDGKPYFSLARNDTAFGPVAPWPFDAPFGWVFNITMGGKWPGEPDAAIEAGEMLVDYVRVYEAADAAQGPGDADRATTDTGSQVAKPKN